MERNEKGYTTRLIVFGELLYRVFYILSFVWRRGWARGKGNICSVRKRRLCISRRSLHFGPSVFGSAVLKCTRRGVVLDEKKKKKGGREEEEKIRNFASGYANYCTVSLVAFKSKKASHRFSIMSMRAKKGTPTDVQGDSKVSVRKNFNF